MTIRTILLCFLVWSALPYRAYTRQRDHQLDSLKELLATTSQPEEQVRLRYLIGIRTGINRIPYWDSLIKESWTLHLPLIETRAWFRIGLIHRSRDEINASIHAYSNSLRVAEENGLRVRMIEPIRQLEKLYGQQFDRKRSLAIIYKGIRIAEELNDTRALMDFYSSLAVYYLTSGETRKALNIHLRCLQICREINYEFGIASSLVDIGSDYMALEQPLKAVPYYLESGRYAHADIEPVYKVQIITSVAAAYQYLNQHDSAFHYAHVAYNIARKHNIRRAMASCMVMLSGLYYAEGNNKKARQLAEDALALSRAVQFTSQIPSLSNSMKKIYLKDGDYKKALESYELHVSTRDSLSGETERTLALEKEFAYNLEKKENQYRLLSQQNRIQSLELSKNRYLLFGLASTFVVLLLLTWIMIRQNQLQTQHQRIQLEQKLLRSQMNPHFVFNSLNSIQQLVMAGKNERAERYLSKFSKMIRDLLEGSSRETLTVNEEIDMLNVYLEMESLRFGGTFSWSVTVDKRIDADKTLIPPFMIQPFAENAIWHGLLPKTNDRHLEITIEYHTEKTLKCTIDDNGVGREVSRYKENTSKKKSLGLSFVKQRIGLIRETYKIAGSVDIIDKKDVNSNSLGTTVIIILPIILA